MKAAARSKFFEGVSDRKLMSKPGTVQQTHLLAKKQASVGTRDKLESTEVVMKQTESHQLEELDFLLQESLSDSFSSDSENTL